MRSRLALIWILVVLGAALTLPATTLAGEGTGYSYREIYSYCEGTTVHFKVKNIAEGFTDANKITIDSWAQKAPGKDGPWTRIYSWNRAKFAFDTDGQKHWLTSWRSYNGNNTAWFQIVFRLRTWHNGTVLASVDVGSAKC